MNSVVLKITARIGFTITDLMNDDWTNLRGLKWGLFPPNIMLQYFLHETYCTVQ